MGRKSLKQLRQKEIIEAFYEKAKSEGLENTSIAKVAKDMDINPSLILHYFKSKGELLFALIDLNLEKYHGIYQNGHQGIHSVHDLVQLIDDLFSRKWNDLYDDGVFYSCYAMVYRDEDVKKSYKKLHDQLRQWLLEALKEAKDKELIDDLSISLEEASEIILP
ncbi:MAG: TetR/AcrR family transcriptional regulator [Bacteroidia bacterium]|nr:TetR/AcrR family transcriptional regulator [Bacteroidia bacterium]